MSDHKRVDPQARFTGVDYRIEIQRKHQLYLEDQNKPSDQPTIENEPNEFKLQRRKEQTELVEEQRAQREALKEKKRNILKQEAATRLYGEPILSTTMKSMINSDKLSTQEPNHAANHQRFEAKKYLKADSNFSAVTFIGDNVNKTSKDCNRDMLLDYSSRTNHWIRIAALRKYCSNLGVNYHKILSFLGDFHSMKQHLVNERGYDSKTVGKAVTVKNYVQTWEKLISDENWAI